MIKPTAGRIVFFTPSTLEGEAVQAYGHPCAAIVTHVWSDRMVNLTVFSADGKSYAKTSVALIQDDDTKSDHGFYCEWMPYQKGQAAKTEALEKQLVEANA
jgi:hypothetical protein